MLSDLALAHAVAITYAVDSLDVGVFLVRTLVVLIGWAAMITYVRPSR
jgi:hypothetical protein